jgi:hypothetical protein
MRFIYGKKKKDQELSKDVPAAMPIASQAGESRTFEQNSESAVGAKATCWPLFGENI